MNLECDAQITAGFSSRSQQVRVATEAWFGAQSYCLSCTSNHLVTSKPNAKARDFYCAACSQTYELKSSGKLEDRRIVDGAYATMIDRIESNSPPILVLLRYIRKAGFGTEPWLVDRLMAIHPVFLTRAIVEPRKPLSLTARRAGWQGCNLRIDRIPQDGRILLVDSGRIANPENVRALYESSKRLLAISPDARSWTAMVLRIVRDIGHQTFTLADAYARSKPLEEVFPNNRHINAKIRQQLQVLRDLGYLQFSGRGIYKIIG